LYLNIDLSAATFHESIPLIQYAAKVLGRRNPDELKRGITQSDYQKLEKSIKNIKFRVTHRGEAASRRKYRIRGLTPTPPERTFFNITINNQTTQISVATHFRNTYNRNLQFPALPCVVVRPECYLPMEVCHIIEVSD